MGTDLEGVHFCTDSFFNPFKNATDASCFKKHHNSLVEYNYKDLWNVWRVQVVSLA